MEKGILVTGCKGQLGSEIKNIIGEKAGWFFEDSQTLDIRDFRSCEIFFQQNNIGFVINCAAYTAVDKAEEDRENANNVNHLAVKNLATLCKQLHAQLIHISTDYVFNGESSKPLIESDETSPINYYGETKLLGENAIQAEGINAIIVRTAWVYSEFGNNFVKTMLRLSSEREEISVVNDQIGSPTYAADLAAVCITLYELRDKWKRGVEIYHYSNGGEISWYDFAKEIIEISGNQCSVNPIPSSAFVTKAKRPKFSLLSKAKIEKDFGIVAPFWKESLLVCMGKLIK